jgi:hypothetical protein
LRSVKPLPGERRDAVSIPPASGEEAPQPEVETQKESTTNTTATATGESTSQESEPTEENDAETTDDDDSTEQLGNEEADKLDRNIDGNNEDDEDFMDDDGTKSAKVTTMFQTILALRNQSGEVAVNEADLKGTSFLKNTNECS